MLGSCSARLLLQGNYEAAADELHTALGLATDFDVAYSLALADLELKKISLATVLFDEMKNSMPETAQLHALIGRAFLATDYPQLATENSSTRLRWIQSIRTLIIWDWPPT